jgi:tRNA(Ile)-lysidine synthase
MKGPEASLIDRVVGIISRYNMFPPNARVGVAISGGADSVCLLHVLRTIRHHWNLRLTALHVNHLLRSEESDQDEQFVRDLSDSWSIPLISERVDVRALAAQHTDNLEQAARKARREFFRRHLESGGADRIALAHTRSDQAETVLFRLLRGAYTTGLSGMRPISSGGIVRPLLDVDRSEVEGYLSDNGITWRQDSSNSDLRFARNRIRHQLLPQLAGEWNPQLRHALARYAALAQDDEEYWTEVTGSAQQLLEPGVGGSLILNIRDAKLLPRAVVRRLLRRAVELVRGDLRRIDFIHLDRVLALTDSVDGHDRVQLPGVDVMRSFEWVRFAAPAPSPAERDWILRVAVPGTVEVPGTKIRLSLELIESQTENPRDTLEAGLDWTRVQSAVAAAAGSANAGLFLRNWRPGDGYERAGDQRSYKLKERFQEQRIPLWERRNWPVLCAGSTILWAHRFGPARNVAAGPSSRRTLRVTERM